VGTNWLTGVVLEILEHTRGAVSRAHWLLDEILFAESLWEGCWRHQEHTGATLDGLLWTPHPQLTGVVGWCWRCWNMLGQEFGRLYLLLDGIQFAQLALEWCWCSLEDIGNMLEPHWMGCYIKWFPGHQSVHRSGTGNFGIHWRMSE
jgi:hypothetical protein